MVSISPFPVLVVCVRRALTCTSACLSALAGQLAAVPVAIESSLLGPALLVAVPVCLPFLGLLHRDVKCTILLQL